MSTQLTASEAGLPGALPGVECRVHERYESDLETSCRPLAAHGARDVTWPAKIKDISLGGMGLVLQRRFERGATLAVVLPEADTDASQTILARVVHATARSDGSWLLGCSFVRQLSEDTLQALVDYARRQRGLPSAESQPPAARADSQAEAQKRSLSFERSQGPRQVLIAGVHFKGLLSDGTMIRRFVTRLYLSGAWPLSPGMFVRGCVGRELTPQPAFRARVLLCRQYDNRWKLSCRFLDESPAAIRELFGFTADPV